MAFMALGVGAALLQNFSLPWSRAVPAILVPLGGAVALYLFLGSPTKPPTPHAVHMSASLDSLPLEGLAMRLETHLRAKPQDAKGWVLLAPVLKQLGRLEDAAEAYEQALRLEGFEPSLVMGYGEILVELKGGVVTKRPRQLFERVLKRDPDNLRAAYFMVLAAHQDGDKNRILERITLLQKKAPPGSPTARFFQQELRRLR